MRDWSDDEEGPDPDYGVFGDAGQPRPIPAPDSPRQIAQRRRWRERREQERQTSSNFNRHMIDLFNARKP